MITKLQKLKDCLAAGDSVGALRIAAKFPQLGAEKEAITRAWAAYQAPELYEAMGKNVDEIVAAGIAALKTKYKIGE